MLVKIDRAFHALTCFSPFYGDFSRSCVFGAMRLSLCSAQLWEYFTGARRSNDAGWAAVWWNLPFGSPWADFECRYAYRYIQISAPPDRPWKYPSVIYREIWGFGHDYLKSLQFVHDDSPSCIVSTRDFCWWWRGFQRVDFSEMGLLFWGRYDII